MKYIPGTKFINRTGRNTRLFPSNVVFTLYDINKTTNENVTYIFLANKELREVKFKSIKEAEGWLENILI